MKRLGFLYKNTRADMNRTSTTEECCVCKATIDEDDGDVRGYFGIIPTSFCVWCVSSVTDMVIQMHGFNDIEVLQERIDEIRSER
jgi:hypothetical protein